MKRFPVIALLLILISGCAQFTLVDAGPQTVGSLQFTTQTAWNKAAFNVGKNTIIWTKDGLALNQLIFFDGIEDDKPIMRPVTRELPMPVFRADMLPNELAELVETSLRNYNGGAVQVSSKNLRPQEMGEHLGFRFDIHYRSALGLAKSGEVISVVKDNKLYMLLFDAAALHYQPKEADEIDSMFSHLSI